MKTESPPDLHRIGLISIASEPHTIWVNKKGKRFSDEDFNNTSIVSSNAIVQQPDNTCYTLWDSEITWHWSKHGPKRAMGMFRNVEGDKLPRLVEELREQAEKGLVGIFDSWDEMADWIGADRQVLKTTIDEYNAACDRGYDPLFAKNPEYLLPLHTPPYYAIKWHSSYINSIGGIKINEHMEVLDKQNSPISGLFAAGVDTGGWESGTYCMLLPGHAFGFSVNSGRIAGENAARFVRGK